MFLEQIGAAQGTLIVDAYKGGTGVTPLGLPTEVSPTFGDAVVIQGSGTHATSASPGQTVDFQNALTVSSGAVLSVPGMLFSDGSVEITGGVLAGSQVVVQSLTVQQGGVVEAQNHELDLTVTGTVTVDSTSQIDVNGQGYAGRTTTGGPQVQAGKVEAATAVWAACSAVRPIARIQSMVITAIPRIGEAVVPVIILVVLAVAWYV